MPKLRKTSMTPVKPKRKRRRKGRYKRGVHTSPKAGDCSYRSGWELAYMIYLDDNSDVLTYDYEKLVIEYVSCKKTGRKRKYYPDFVVTYADRVEVIEIKPTRRMTRHVVIKKAHAAIEWCKQNGSTYIILTEVELKALGLL